MKIKQIPFSLEMVEKIQAGEIKGIIKTRDGRPARYLGKMNDNRFPLVFVYTLDESGEEAILCNTIIGLCSYSGGWSDDDIIIEIEEPKLEHQFKPFEKVLVRNDINSIWQPSIFSYQLGDCYYTVSSYPYNKENIIPYEGNEHLVGTTNKQKED